MFSAYYKIKTVEYTLYELFVSGAIGFECNMGLASSAAQFSLYIIHIISFINKAYQNKVTTLRFDRTSAEKDHHLAFVNVKVLFAARR